MYKNLVTLTNVNIVCHTHELRIIMAIRRKCKGQQGSSVGGKANYFVPIPTPQDECKLHILQTCSSKKVADTDECN